MILRGTNNLFANLMGEELTLKEYEFKIVDHFLKTYNDNIPLVSEKLDIGKSTIYKMLKEKSQTEVEWIIVKLLNGLMV